MLNSSLHNESTFYHVFVEDLLHAKLEVVIESPFITSGRMKRLSSIFQTLVDNNIKIYVVTRNPNEHPEPMNYQAEKEIRKFEEIGVQVLIYKKGHHRKLAVIDRKILWEGSLNILSQNDSREFMRKIDNKKITEQTFKFLNLERYF